MIQWVGFLMVFCVVMTAGCAKEADLESFEPASTESASPQIAVVAAKEAEQTPPAAASLPKITGAFRGFSVYSDENATDNHYFPSGWMGDYADITFDSVYMNDPHSGTTSVKIVYSNKASQGARWTGIYWQNPANNWGNRAGGYDLTGAARLVFWARGEKGGERIEEFKVGGVNGEFSDSDVAGIGPVILKPEWQKYEIDLSGKDLTSIIGGFAWSANLDHNPDGLTFYLDDIRFA